MSVKIMLRHMFNLKFAAWLFVINLLNDFIGLGNCNKIKENIRPEDLLQLPFERFICNQINVLSFAMYLSFAGFIAFAIINAVNSDNQKIGIFILTRMNRKRYAVNRIFSALTFVLASCALSVFQSFVSHRAAHIVHPVSTYFVLFAAAGITVLCASFIGMCVCSAFQEPRIAFLLSVVFFAAFSAIISALEIKIPTFGNTDIVFLYPAVFAAAFAALFAAVTFKQDFITTKIKE